MEDLEPKNLMSQAAELYNSLYKYADSNIIHPRDMQDITDAIHTIQRIISTWELRNIKPEFYH